MTVGRLKFHDSSGWVYAGAGLSGYSGYSGIGTSGYSGYSGISGYSGPSGYSGYSGPSGYSGYSGPAGSTAVGFSFVIDAGTNAIATGIKGDIQIPFDSTITEARLGADVSGAIAIGVWACSGYSGYPPVVGGLIDTFAIAATGIKSEETGLSIAVAAGDWLRFNVDSCTTIKRVTLALIATRD